MATELQKRANRSNALKSTGPTSEAGKAAVRLNATRHGLLSSAPIMAGEDESEYAALCEQLKTELSPVGILETQLASRIAGALWRLQRLSHIEAGILTASAAQTFADAAEAVAKSHTRTVGGLDVLIASMSEDETVIENEEAHADAKDAAAAACAVAWSAPAMMGAAYKNEAGTLDTLARYETTLDRQLTRATEQLEKLQAARIGKGAG